MRDRAPVFIALADLLMCLLVYVLVAVNPVRAKIDGVKPPALYLLSIEWDTKQDIDPDIWLITPIGPVCYQHRQTGDISLDQDNKGWNDDGIGPDGKRVSRAREVITIRGITPGHYDLGVNLYGYRVNNGDPPQGQAGLRVHVMIQGMEPDVKTRFESDVTLDRVKQTINTTSFDMSADGSIAFVDPPLTPVTEAFLGKAQ